MRTEIIAQKYGLPKTIADLEKHCLIGFDRDALVAAQSGHSCRAR